MERRSWALNLSSQVPRTPTGAPSRPLCLPSPGRTDPLRVLCAGPALWRHSLPRLVPQAGPPEPSGLSPTTCPCQSPPGLCGDPLYPHQPPRARPSSPFRDPFAHLPSRLMGGSREARCDVFCGHPDYTLTVGSLGGSQVEKQLALGTSVAECGDEGSSLSVSKGAWNLPTRSAGGYGTVGLPGLLGGADGSREDVGSRREKGNPHESFKRRGCNASMMKGPKRQWGDPLELPSRRSQVPPSPEGRPVLWDREPPRRGHPGKGERNCPGLPLPPSVRAPADMTRRELSSGVQSPGTQSVARGWHPQRWMGHVLGHPLPAEGNEMYGNNEAVEQGVQKETSRQPALGRTVRPGSWGPQPEPDSFASVLGVHLGF